ncbi:MAG: 50S ribosomal protein L10 [Candidatus Woykebacteria bacterium RBG_13_40_7b]|uniref:Large ribosomal subunit protein uL10 n=1 Tax=Candidatus Woykebacteria bacterium RBG_13_40_7b TaxID=1802594 RepID=A0A1G1WA31_9BACT|nr:MAG: 50S ribosomal protein L10 [Candidatus Woykebacteria bacterium RBG_13_40_7b]
MIKKSLQEKIEKVKRLKEKLKSASGFILTDPSGLKVKDAQVLKENLLQIQGDFFVVKNTLLKRALKESDYDEIPQDLQGPTAVVLIKNDELLPLKEIVQFSEAKELLKIKIGFLEKAYVGSDELLKLAALPSKKELIAFLVANLNSPISGLTYTLQANLQGLVFTLDQMKNRSN